MLGASQALMAGIMAMVTGNVYEQFGRLAAFATVAGSMLVLTAVGVWLARDEWSMRRPIATV